MTELIYDLRTQPWSLGDILVAQAAKLTECDEYDIVFLHDPRVRPDNFKFIPAEFGDYLNWTMASAKAMKSTKSVTIRPATDEPLGNYRFYDFMEKIVAKPTVLQVRDDLREWAEAFHKEHGTIGTVNIRKNPYTPHYRDANVDAWREFLESVDERLVVLGDVPIDGNHIYSTHSTEKQLALIQTSNFHMGSSSGPLSMAIHGTHPYRAFNTNAFAIMPQYFNGNSLKFGPKNRWFEGREEYGLLKFQYESLIKECCL